MSKSLKLGFWGLVGLVISAMVGSGVFSLPQNMARGAGVGGIAIAWVITAVGMFFLADTFRILSTVKPGLTSGIYNYAKHGFGETAGFFVAWGYWFSNVFAITAFLVILTEALNYFFPPHFHGGNTVPSLILSSIVLWGFFALISKGIKKAAFVNLIGTCFKLIPILVFIGFIIFYFKFTFLKEAFNASFDANAMDGMTLLQQVRNTMIITLWTFIGIEAAVAMSGKVENQRQVSNAILTAFIICIIMYALVSMLPFGILTREQIAAYPNPSTAGILEYLAGKSGGILMNVGLVVSVLFSVLSLTTVTAEVPFSAAKDKTFPVKFTKENKNGVPVFSLFITALAIQLSFFIGFVSENAFHTLITITAVMVMPVYLATTLYLFKITSKKAFDTNLGIGRGRAYLTGIMGIMYTLWLIYAANIKYLVMAVIFFLAGVPVYLLARKEAKKN